HLLDLASFPTRRSSDLFYGCHILRPPQIMGFENPLNPQSMERVAEALGAECVDFDQRLACCGFHAVFPAEKEVMKLTGINCLSSDRKSTRLNSSHVKIS